MGFTICADRLRRSCIAIAPSLIPMKSGDRVKTDRRDAMMLGKLHRADQLTAIWFSGAAHETMRELVWARATAARNRPAAAVWKPVLVFGESRRIPHRIVDAEPDKPAEQQVVLDPLDQTAATSGSNKTPAANTVLGTHCQPHSPPQPRKTANRQPFSAPRRSTPRLRNSPPSSDMRELTADFVSAGE